MSYTASPSITVDDELIRTCVQHAVNMRAFNANSAAEGSPENEALWDAYEATRDAITDAEPRP